MKNTNHLLMRTMLPTHSIQDVFSISAKAEKLATRL